MTSGLSRTLLISAPVVGFLTDWEAEQLGQDPPLSLVWFSTVEAFTPCLAWPLFTDSHTPIPALGPPSAQSRSV